MKIHTHQNPRIWGLVTRNGRFFQSKRLTHSHPNTNSKPRTPTYITTPIFYVNANPHLGHLYNMLLCDTKIRWEKLKQIPTFFTTGTDEHGLKIQAVAEKQGISPKDLCDKVSQNFHSLAETLDVGYDRFIRTTDPDHVKAAQYFWNIFIEKGLIHEGKHSGWYSVSDETFYPETQIEEFQDQELGEKLFRSKETKSVVVFQEETNYFFKLSEYQNQLIEYLEKNPKFIIPEAKYQQVLTELKESKLPDLSISRPSSRLTWAIEIPNDPSQRMYVWFDALVNYLTSAGFPATFEKKINPINGEISFQNIGDFHHNQWPATHVVGKDIIRFHAIYWPIFLMAAEIEPPKQVVVHSHWLCNGFKMSKSIGNVVDPLQVSAYYGTDAFRFFLMEYSTLDSDCNYQEDEFYFTRGNIISKYANLVSRCGGPNFNIERAINSFKKGEFDNIEQLILESEIKDKNKLIESTRRTIEVTNSAFEQMDACFAEFDQQKAIHIWWQLCEAGNEIFQLSQPWTYVKTSSENINHQLLMDYYTFLALEISRVSSILIQPIMPDLSSKILDRLNVKPENRISEFARLGADVEYGRLSNDPGQVLPISRIPKMPTAEETEKGEQGKNKKSKKHPKK